MLRQAGVLPAGRVPVPELLQHAGQQEGARLGYEGDPQGACGCAVFNCVVYVSSATYAFFFFFYGVVRVRYSGVRVLVCVCVKSWLGGRSACSSTPLQAAMQREPLAPPTPTSPPPTTTTTTTATITTHHHPPPPPPPPTQLCAVLSHQCPTTGPPGRVRGQDDVLVQAVQLSEGVLQVLRRRGRLRPELHLHQLPQ